MDMKTKAILIVFSVLAFLLILNAMTPSRKRWVGNDSNSYIIIIIYLAYKFNLMNTDQKIFYKY